jgi:hypothetical protein
MREFQCRLSYEDCRPREYRRRCRRAEDFDLHDRVTLVVLEDRLKRFQHRQSLGGRRNQVILRKHA